MCLCYQLLLKRTQLCSCCFLHQVAVIFPLFSTVLWWARQSLISALENPRWLRELARSWIGVNTHAQSFMHCGRHQTSWQTWSPPEMQRLSISPLFENHRLECLPGCASPCTAAVLLLIHRKQNLKVVKTRLGKMNAKAKTTLPIRCGVVERASAFVSAPKG